MTEGSRSKVLLSQAKRLRCKVGQIPHEFSAFTCNKDKSLCLQINTKLSLFGSVLESILCYGFLLLTVIFTINLLGNSATRKVEWIHPKTNNIWRDQKHKPYLLHLFSDVNRHYSDRWNKNVPFQMVEHFVME